MLVDRIHQFFSHEGSPGIFGPGVAKHVVLRLDLNILLEGGVLMAALSGVERVALIDHQAIEPVLEAGGFFQGSDMAEVAHEGEDPSKEILFQCVVE